MMEKDRGHMTERILNLTLEIISLLTGEDYTIMNKSGEHVTPGGSTCVLRGFNETKIPITVPPPRCHVHETSRDLKILEVTNKIIQLLTGEVPIRCQDVSVNFSMEEWEYIEGHQDLYKDIIMENHQTLPSVDGLKKKNTPEKCLHRLFLNGYKEEDHLVLQEYRGEDLIDVKVEVLEVEEQRCVSWDQQCRKKKIPTHISTVENITRNTLEEHLFSSSDCEIENCSFQHNSSGAHTITVDVPLVLPRADLLPDHCIDNGCFADKTDFVTHSRTHGAGKAFSCSECYECFTQNADLIRHQKTHKGEKPFLCCDCGGRFTERATLTEHQRIHTGEKPFPCFECGKWFTQKAHLIAHKRVHTGEKPFPCFECGKWFTKKSTLTEHQRIHTGEKLFPCSECGKCFRKKSILTEHQRIHTGEKRFPCSECGKCFRKKSNVTQHQRIHTGDKPFSCSDCGKRFTLKSNLTQHQKIHSAKIRVS